MEIWKKVGSYKVSSYGRVWSNITSKYLKLTETKEGYRVCRVHNVTYFVHRLVVQTFLGDIPEGLVVNHLDGVKGNNLLSNLEITTYSENLKHAHALGLACNKGSRNSQSKVTEEDITAMYKLFEAGFNNASVAVKFDLHDRYISLIRHGKRWKHVYNLYNKVFPKSFSYKYSPETLLYARTLIALGYSNKSISEITGIEKSSVSKLKTAGLYGDFFQTWDTYGIATTKERVGEEKNFTENRVL